MSNIPKVEAILFDMDGTLVDTEPVGQETLRDFLLKNNITISANDWNLFDKVWRRDGTKITFEEFISDILKKYADIVDAKNYISDFYHNYENNILLSKPLPGANEALSYLKNKYKLALVTASTTSQAKLILRNNNWDNNFDIVISHDDFQKSKPDPECFLTAANRLGVDPEKCVVIEDSKNGTIAGRNGGMFVVGVKAGNKHAQDLSAANIILETLDGIKNIL